MEYSSFAVLAKTEVDSSNMIFGKETAHCAKLKFQTVIEINVIW